MKNQFLFSSHIAANGMIPGAKSATGNATLFALFSLITLAGTSAQAAVVTLSKETFPNTFNTNFVAPANNVNSGNFTGDIGTWKATSNANATVVATQAYYSPVTQAIKLVNWNTSGIGAGESHAASPTVSLAPTVCSTDVKLTYKLYTYTVAATDTNSLFKVEFSTNNGSSWSAVQSFSAAQLRSTYGQNGLTTLNVDIPSSYRVPTFKYRFSGYKAGNQANDFYLFVDEPTITYEQCSSLPVDLISFDLNENANNVTLSWVTAAEIGFSGFEVERSTDGSNFTALGTVAATGANAGSTGRYSYNDSISSNGSNYYYRLKMVDLDGKFKYSSIKALRTNDGSSRQSIYPNPARASEGTTLSIVSPTREQATVQIVNMNGAIVSSQSIQIDKGTNQKTISLSGLPNGNYALVVITRSGDKTAHRIIVQR